MIIDGHTHLFSGFGSVPGMSTGELADSLRGQGVDRAVLFTVEGFLREDCRKYNDEIAAAARQSDGFFIPFGTVHPRAGDAAVAEMRRCVEDLGMRGFKLHPWLQAFCASGPEMFPIVEAAIDLKRPLLFHDGTPPYSMPLQVAYLARCFPEATIILGHSGLRDCWREALYAAKKYRNIILQFCGVPLIGMRQIVSEIGWERCVFGSDAPFNGKSATEQMIALINELDIPARGKAAILGQNLAPICFGSHGHAENR